MFQQYRMNLLLNQKIYTLIALEFVQEMLQHIFLFLN